MAVLKFGENKVEGSRYSAFVMSSSVTEIMSYSRIKLF